MIRNVQFTAPGNLPPIALYGVEDVPVTIESNQVDAATVFAMVLSEVNASVTIRGNPCRGGGLGLDGDIEGEGRSGALGQPYLVENNTINAAGGQGVTAQDLTDVTLRGNGITGVQGVAVTAGTARLFGNTIQAELALTVAQTGGATTLVRLTDGNQVTGAVLVGPGASSTPKATPSPAPWRRSRRLHRWPATLRPARRSATASAADCSTTPCRPTPLDRGCPRAAIDFNGNGCQDIPATVTAPTRQLLPPYPVPQPALPPGF